MSFIPSRDVFDMPPSELLEIEAIYDILEQRFTEDYVKDECGSDWTVQDYIEHYGCHPCPSFGAFNMLVYAARYFKENGLPNGETSELGSE